MNVNCGSVIGYKLLPQEDGQGEQLCPFNRPPKTTSNKLLTKNVRETRRGNQEWTIQKNWQHWVPDTEYRQTTRTIQKNWQH